MCFRISKWSSRSVAQQGGQAGICAPECRSWRCINILYSDIYSLFTWPNQKWLFWRAGFYSAIHINQKSFQKALNVWKKAGPSKKHFCFDHVNRILRNEFFSRSLGQNMPKNTYFLEKKAVKLPKRLGIRPRTPVGLRQLKTPPPNPSALLLPLTDIDLSKCVYSIEK